MIKVRFHYKTSTVEFLGGVNSVEVNVKDRTDAMVLVQALEKVDGIISAKAIDFFEPEVVAEFKAEEHPSPSEA